MEKHSNHLSQQEPGAGSAKRHIRLSVVLPVRNEGVNLKILIKIMEAVFESQHEILVVYDFPEDDSIPVVSSIQPNYPNVRLIHNTYGPGVVRAISAGVDAAEGDYVLIFAADEIGPVLAVEDMLALMDEGCDLVSVTRYAYGGRRLGGSLIGCLLSRFANGLFVVIAKAAFTDSTTGMKMFRREVFKKMNLEARPVGWAVAFEMSIKAQLAGLIIGEVPTISIDRLYGGKSTFRLGSWTVEYLRWFLWGAVRLRRACKGKRPVARVRVPMTTAG
jgi:dolichol-phosphate mannosyltransferase